MAARAAGARTHVVLVASWVRGAERTGMRTVSIRGEDPLAMFRSFVAVTYITRVAEGR
jgi:D-amino peptidase